MQITVTIHKYKNYNQNINKLNVLKDQKLETLEALKCITPVPHDSGNNS